jgi:NAD(P)-dependent dehydrogenase (short-subunit alcohol dehydrogenase family)
VALITGGNSEIGLGMAEALAAAGAGVAIWGTSADKEKAALGPLEAHGTLALAAAAPPSPGCRPRSGAGS